MGKISPLPSSLRIVLLNDTFTELMGYSENCLARSFARLGHDVHVIASDLQAYHHLPNYNEIYGRFLGPAKQPCGTKELDGFTLHRLPHALLLGYVWLPRVFGTLASLRPQVVQTLATANWIAMQAALGQLRFGYALFTSAHQATSVFSARVRHAGRLSWARLGSDLRRALPGRLVSTVAEKCYAVTADCGEIAIRYYGVPRCKVEVVSLGVDTWQFQPANGEETQSRRKLKRHQLAVGEDELLCLYTGRLTPEKDPLCLAHAIRLLRASGSPFRGLFIGNGPQSGEIAAMDGCSVVPFQPWRELPDWYRAADIAVWPREESISQLDAIACGLPIVVGHHLRTRIPERIEGNGLDFIEGDPTALSSVLLRLREPGLRHELGSFGATKIQTSFSWDAIARRRVEDYRKALMRGDNRIV